VARPAKTFKAELFVGSATRMNTPEAYKNVGEGIFTVENEKGEWSYGKKIHACGKD
jgi:hypothetical protein